ALAFFFFSSRRRHTRFSRDWSSDVCSSDLFTRTLHLGAGTVAGFLHAGDLRAQQLLAQLDLVGMVLVVTGFLADLVQAHTELVEIGRASCRERASARRRRAATMSSTGGRAE